MDSREVSGEPSFALDQPAAPKAKVLLVDDEVALLTATRRILERSGFEVVACDNGDQALRAMAENRLDAVISDVSMPGMTGIELLRAVRTHDMDLPVILVTGGPSLQTAMEALDHGAFRYLVKPVDLQELVDVTQRATQLKRLARAKQEALIANGQSSGVEADLLGMQATLDSALDSLWPAFQPIIRADGGSLFAYEALMRCDEPMLPNPGAILDTAERLDQLPGLFKRMRSRTAAVFDSCDSDAVLFFNLHPIELHDEELLSPDSPIFGHARRTVLEVTERATLERMGDVRGRIVALREAGYRIAIDDLGAGYAGLTSFATLEPEFVKLDMSLIRDVHKTTIKQRLVRVMTSLCHDMNMQVVAEGIETEDERDAVVELGCDLLQGYRFGRPSRAFGRPSW